VAPKLGVKTLQDFIAAAKKEPMNFASGGNGSPGHLSQAQITEATGAKLTHIPYKGNAPAVLAIVSGEVQGGTLATPGMLPQVKAGKIVPLAVTSPQRSPLLPEVPTVGESGFKSLDYEVNYVVMAPRGLPPQVAATLDQALRAAMADPELLQQFRQLDVVPDPMGAAAAQARLEAQSKSFERLVKSAGVSIN
jgi:tripartite-type tricarboxylate transporter receptor subunit TctC